MTDWFFEKISDFNVKGMKRISHDVHTKAYLWFTEKWHWQRPLRQRVEGLQHLHQHRQILQGFQAHQPHWPANTSILFLTLDSNKK